MKLELSKPICFIDLETTGLDVAKDRIVEISILKINVQGNKKILTKRINPGIPISPESTSIHGISDSDVKDEPTFKELSGEIKSFLENADLGGYNSNKFDIPLLLEEFYRNDVEIDLDKRKLIDVQNIFHKMEKRTLEAAYKFYCNKDLVNSHSAESDILATYEVLEAQLDRYKDLKPTPSFLEEFSSMNKNVDFAGRVIFDEGGIEIFNFGKYKGQTVKSVFEKDPSYYGWIMGADFTQNTKRVITAIKLKSIQ